MKYRKPRFSLKIINIILVILFFGEIAHTQNVQVSAKFDSTNNILIGDQVKIKLQAICPKGTILMWPTIKDTIIKQIEVASRTKIDSVFSSDKKSLTLSQIFTITSFDSGTYKIPAFEFNYRFLKDTNNYTALTNELYLNVNTIAVDTTKEIRDIKTPLKAPISFRELLPYIGGVVILSVIILLIIYYIQKKRKAEPLIRFKQVRVVPAHEIALLALQKLKDDKLWQNNKVKLYYVELTDILRKYIENRFEIDALEMTTDEITASFKTIDIAEELKRKLRNILILADLVKFAKAQPLANEHDICLENAFDLVNNTIPEIVNEETVNVIEDQNNENIKVE
jgi:hypothetical protein